MFWYIVYILNWFVYILLSFKAIECFKKAISLEPENESYKTNLKLAEDKLSAAGSPGAATAGLPPGGKQIQIHHD